MVLTYPASRDHAVNLRTLSLDGTLVNATRSAAVSHITAVKGTNWLESKQLIVRLTGLGHLKNCRLVFVSKRHAFG